MKKIISILLAAGMVFSFSSPALAAAVSIAEKPVDEIIESNTINEPTPEMMEEMIVRVRPLIDVPEEYTEFGWDFYGKNNYSSTYWSFYWYDVEGTGEISVTCDTQGRITSYNVYEYNNQNRNSASLPAISPEELMPEAKKFIEKTAPYLAKMDLRLEEIRYPSVFYNPCYTYVFTRYENDIPVRENTVNIQVNHLTKKVTSFSTNVSADLEFKNPEKLIGEDKAKEILSDVQEMKLSYRLKTEYNEDGKLSDRYAYLVYTPSLSYVSVDAQTGKVYTERNTWTALKAPSSVNGSIMMDSAAKEESAEAGGGRYQLSEKELEQLAVLESLITKDEAAKVIFEDEHLYIAENAYLSDARLSKRYTEPRPLYYLDGNEDLSENEEKYTWNLYFSTPGEMYLGMNAVVDAHDGTLLSYSAELPYVYQYEKFGIEEPEVKFTKEQAVKIASEFLAKHQKERFALTRYSADSEYSPYKYVVNEQGDSIPYYRASTITFVRVNEGIDFTYNSFNMGVDRASGKITRYSYSWYDDIRFESPKDAVGEKKALESLYKDNGFEANYEICKDNTYVEGKLNSVNTTVYSRSVYSLVNPLTTTIRALDGKLINYNNEEVKYDEKTFEYTDIENHWAKDTIKRFTYIGYGPEGNLFRPNDSITGEEFVSLCEAVRIYGDTAELVKLENVTRMGAVKVIIDHLGYGKIAKLENVFITDFADNSDFRSEDIGYAAIARGFGLIEGDGENFRPYDTLTRAEALTIIENIIELHVLDK